MDSCTALSEAARSWGAAPVQTGCPDVDIHHFSEIHEIKSMVLEGIGPRDIIEATLPPMSHSQRVALKAFLAQIEERCGQNFLTELMTFKDMELVLIAEVPTELLLAFGAKSGLVGSA